MGTKHTADEWYVDDEYEEEVLAITSNARLGKIPIATLSVGYEGPVETEQYANAKLIAAAPDLLAAAVEAIKLAREPFPGPGLDAYNALKAAIAKATN